jgi:hypothetical protein
MISLGGLVSQKAFGKFEMGKVISNPFANAFVNEAEGEDHEVSMANNSIDTIIKMATELKSKMGEDEKQIPAWIQDHIAKAENLISQASTNYHEYGDSNESINEAPKKLKHTISKKEWSKIPKYNKHIGMDGIHYIMKYDDKIGTYLQGVQIVDESIKEAAPCWKGYKQVGMKDKGGRQVPNCVPNESVVKEASYTNYNLGKVQYTDKNMTPTDILSLAMAYVETSGNKMLGGKLSNMVTVANDLARLTGTTQLNAKERGKKPALIIHLLKNKLVSKDEYVKLYKDLIEKQMSVIKSLKNADPASRMVGGAAARQAHKDMKGQFDMD